MTVVLEALAAGVGVEEQTLGGQHVDHQNPRNGDRRGSEVDEPIGQVLEIGGEAEHEAMIRQIVRLHLHQPVQLLDEAA